MEVYQPDRSLPGKLRRRLVRLAHRRAAKAPPGPMVSFSFDDAPLSAATTGAAILQAKGLKGTYFLSAGLAGQASPMGRMLEVEDIRRLLAGGHEIACHTFSHLDCGQAPGMVASEDIERNRAAFEAWNAPQSRTFAYPYGDLNSDCKRTLSSRFSLLRALHHGLVESGSDLNQAPAVGIEGADGEAVARRWLQAAVRRRAWLILYTHDVDERPSEWGCTPQALGRLADEALAAGCRVVTVAEGARLVGGA